MAFHAFKTFWALIVSRQVGKDKQQELGLAENPFANKIETADGLPKIEGLQEDPNEEVSESS